MSVPDGQARQLRTGQPSIAIVVEERQLLEAVGVAAALITEEMCTGDRPGQPGVDQDALRRGEPLGNRLGLAVGVEVEALLARHPLDRARSVEVDGDR